MSTDRAAARDQMVKQQVRAWGVYDDTILDLMAQIPRDAFFPPEYSAFAYADLEAPVGHGRLMLAPKEQGKLLQAVSAKSDETVLVLGTDTGYLTALLARLSKHVYSLDTDAALLEKAKTALLNLAVNNVTLDVQKDLEGAPMFAPFDVIVLTGSVSAVPESLLAQLSDKGRMFAIVGCEPLMQATLYVKGENQLIIERVLYETSVHSVLDSPNKTVFSF
ncbi:MAG: protein-L-isoaspartate O-methyltransferase [Gammaproteobacteria bacterium CG11_big_fil_rev_8_21_14_0_20_46_22]|nr:MAG: protein-L-isoaspartate O-methyltransferase [Gammaproteobacteria bacterium CG12_big_fil_rev_8_21_14_0_65_46_12]PIR10158.1 MAG: protein-L-isoaspartate O-methyltransferase [Gammaproteobacteria bacterium CG11_big_fil_rev_8_21_14_0_20_46_22]